MLCILISGGTVCHDCMVWIDKMCFGCGMCSGMICLCDLVFGIENKDRLGLSCGVQRFHRFERILLGATSSSDVRQSFEPLTDPVPLAVHHQLYHYLSPFPPSPRNAMPPSLPPHHLTSLLPQRLPRKVRQHKTRAVDLLIVIPAQLLLLLGAPFPQRRFHVAILVFAADHEADLAGGVGRDGGVGVFDGGEDFFAGFFEVGD